MTARVDVPADGRQLLMRAYAAHNGQDVEALPARASDDADWPDGEGTMHGKEEVRS